MVKFISLSDDNVITNTIQNFYSYKIIFDTMISHSVIL